MINKKMHVDEVDTDVSLVRRLLTTQFPQWTNLPIQPVQSAGTDNAIYRLGADMTVRLPRYPSPTTSIDKEHYWLPKLAPYLPLSIPVLLALGAPGEGYPFRWSVLKWIEGENLTIDCIADPRQAAIDMAKFITALQRIDTTGAPLATDNNLRGIGLATRDTNTRKAIAAMHGMIDTDAAIRVWETALEAPEWERAPVWFHGDLLPGNVLFKQGRLNAVIDFGGMGVGDPACDIMIAWGLFKGESRDIFREALAVDDATWVRGRGHALSQAVIFIPYYLETNPMGVGNARHMISEVLADYKHGA
jgi:aminoglycoside phosphotransferase (APT) family kinase protein